MSRKTKRLEKENLTLTRKHDLTNRNILEMAEERTRTNKELELLRKKNGNLEKLCRGMQAQGRGGPVPAAEAGADNEEEGTESEYEYDEDEEDEEGSEEEGDYDEDTEDEEAMRAMKGLPKYGPAPPPPPPSATAAPSQAMANGKANRELNGRKH